MANARVEFRGGRGGQRERRRGWLVTGCDRLRIFQANATVRSTSPTGRGRLHAPGAPGGGRPGLARGALGDNRSSSSPLNAPGGRCAVAGSCTGFPSRGPGRPRALITGDGGKGGAGTGPSRHRRRWTTTRHYPSTAGAGRSPATRIYPFRGRAIGRSPWGVSGFRFFSYVRALRDTAATRRTSILRGPRYAEAGAMGAVPMEGFAAFANRGKQHTREVPRALPDYCAAWSASSAAHMLRPRHSDRLSRVCHLPVAWRRAAPHAARCSHTRRSLWAWRPQRAKRLAAACEPPRLAVILPVEGSIPPQRRVEAEYVVHPLRDRGRAADAGAGARDSLGIEKRDGACWRCFREPGGEIGRMWPPRREAGMTLLDRGVATLVIRRRQSEQGQLRQRADSRWCGQLARRPRGGRRRDQSSRGPRPSRRRSPTRRWSCPTGERDHSLPHSAASSPCNGRAW
jgi:hypothetical protein